MLQLSAMRKGLDENDLLKSQKMLFNATEDIEVRHIITKPDALISHARAKKKEVQNLNSISKAFIFDSSNQHRKW